MRLKMCVFLFQCYLITVSMHVSMSVRKVESLKYYRKCSKLLTEMKDKPGREGFIGCRGKVIYNT